MEGIYFIDHYNQSQMLFKKEPFYAEQEYRLFFDPTYYSFFHETFINHPSPRLAETKEKAIKRYDCVANTLQILDKNKKFALMRNGINGYISFSLSLLGDRKAEIIKEIVLGPKCTQDPKELKAFLSYYGYDIEIRKSEIDIR